MKNIKNVSKRIFAMLMVLAMLLCVAVGILLNPAYADEDLSEYSFTTCQLDPEFYAKMYPDVVSSVSDDPYALFMHYCDYGMAEGRIPYAGAQPGEAINGYIGINTSVAATATVVDQSGTTATADDGIMTMSLDDGIMLLAEEAGDPDMQGWYARSKVSKKYNAAFYSGMLDESGQEIVLYCGDASKKTYVHEGGHVSFAKGQNVEGIKKSPTYVVL